MSAAEPLSMTVTAGIPKQRRVLSVAELWRGGPAPEIDPLDLSTPRVRHQVTRREVLWALTLSLLLAAGIVGTLLLQTSMQAEARVAQHERQQLATLQQQAEDLQHVLARDADPSRLAAQAQALHMRPQVRPAFVHQTG